MVEAAQCITYFACTYKLTAFRRKNQMSCDSADLKTLDFCPCNVQTFTLVQDRLPNLTAEFV